MAYQNLGYTPGTGANVATDTISGAAFQRIKLATGAENAATDVSTANPLPTVEIGEMIEAIEALRMAIGALSRTIGTALPDASGRLRMLAENPTAANLNVTASIAASQTLGTVTTVSTVTNQSQLGGFAANDQIPALLRLYVGNIRSSIIVT